MKTTNEYTGPSICPQPGPQTMFSSCSANVVFYGGAAYGGKSFALLLEAIRYRFAPDYTGIIFRRKSTEITTPGGLWDTAHGIYLRHNVGANMLGNNLTSVFPSGSRLKFSHLEHEKNKFDHHGGQYAFIGFDELTTFTKSQFFYLLTRSRPGPGSKLRPIVRCTMNADADSWVAPIISWWWDQATGYPIRERSGIIKWFTIEDDELIWVDKGWKGKGENGEIIRPKSFTFIASTIADNVLGRKADPTYESTLYAQDLVTRERLLKGNWLISYKGGMFDPRWFKIVEAAPPGAKRVRYWDFAGSEVKEDTDPDWTAGALVAEYEGAYYIEDIRRFRKTPSGTETEVIHTAEQDGQGVPIGFEIEAGSSGLFVSDHIQTKVLCGYETHPDRPNQGGGKIARARPWCALAERGHVYIVKGAWNRDFLNEAGSFPKNKKDQIDAVSGAYKLLTDTRRVLHAYRPTEYAHKKEFSITLEDFQKINATEATIYLCLYRDYDSGIYGNCFLWSRKSKRLRVYAEITAENPVLDDLAFDIEQRSVVGTIPKGNMICVGKIVGNDDMFSGGDDLRAILKRANIRISPNRRYDEKGSILLANQMFNQNQIILHPDCSMTDVQYRSWLIDRSGKPASGYAFCKALLMVIGELKEDGEMDPPKILPAYSKEKLRIRESLRNPTSVSNISPKNEFEYLV